MNAQENLRSLLPAALGGQSIELNGESYVLLGPLVVSMGLDWEGQHQKLAADPSRWGLVISATSSCCEGVADSMAALPLRMLPGWLMGIDVAEAHPEIRSWLTGFQFESARVLHAHWSRDAGARSGSDVDTLRRAVQTAVFRAIAEQLDTIIAAIEARVEAGQETAKVRQGKAVH